MSTAQAAVEYRFLIRDFADVLDPGNPNDLQNIITDPLPNGAICYVNAKRACYVLNKHSTASANGADVYAPIAGPGRWYLLTASAGELPPVMAYNTDSNTPAFTCDGAFNQSSSNSFAATELQQQSRWTFTALGCVLTYNGPTIPMMATLTCSVSVTDGTPAQPILGFVSYNDDSGGTTAGGPEGKAIAVCGADGTNWVTLCSQRLVPAVAEGNTFRPKFLCAAGGGAGAIGSLQLVIRPI